MDNKEVFPDVQPSESFFARTQWAWIIGFAIIVLIAWATEIIYGW